MEEDFFEVVADHDEDEEDTHEDAILVGKETITASSQNKEQIQP